MLRPFHLAVQVRDIAEARQFYGEVLGFEEGRSAAHWVDYNFYGHQFVVHLNPSIGKQGRIESNCFSEVDGKQVPSPHFGVVLNLEDWQALAQRLTDKGTEFIIAPYKRFEGEAGEQATLFFLDPSGNALEFKGFASLDQLFVQ